MTEARRYTVLDILRGISLISMIAFHAAWDLVNIFELNLEWFNSRGAEIWQLSIRWCFILLSGFCWPLGQKRLKRALTVLGGAILITVVTSFWADYSFIRFGVLTLIGTAMLITIPLDRLFNKTSPYIGLILCILLFLLTQYAEIGVLSIGNYTLCSLPDTLYANDFTAFLGFPSIAFSSADYVPLMPWIFVYWIGYFAYGILKRKEWLKYLTAVKFAPLEFLGRHSLLIYLLHQPIIYAVLTVVFKAFR